MHETLKCVKQCDSVYVDGLSGQLECRYSCADSQKIEVADSIKSKCVDTC